MKILIIINAAPYGNEVAFNALRLAMSLQADSAKPELSLFLLGDAVPAALPNQMTPQGFYNIERMIKSVIVHQGKVFACSSCLQARGMMELELIEGIEPSTMPEIASLAVAADKVISF